MQMASVHFLLSLFIMWISRTVLAAVPQSHWFDHCPPQSVLAGNFSRMCHSHTGRLLDHRLCLMQEKGNTTILGVDFSDCDLSTFPADFPKSGVRFVFLGSVFFPPNEADYCGFTNLSFLLLNSSSQCPGTHYSWLIDRVLNATGYRECRDQLDFCNTTEHVHSCPSNSRCQFNGPGCLACFCKAGYTGYRCMFRRGFPTITFTLVLLGVLVILTALLLLYRHVRPSAEEPAYSPIPPAQDDWTIPSGTTCSAHLRSPSNVSPPITVACGWYFLTYSYVLFFCFSRKDTHTHRPSRAFLAPLSLNSIVLHSSGKIFLWIIF